jgi:RNA polymerase sigma-70 factor, ECF subfamily
MVWQTAYRLLGNHSDASDCFQETFLTAWEIARVQAVRNLPALLVHLATRRAIDRLRQRTRHERYHLYQERVDLSPSNDNDPARRAQMDELTTRLRQAIADLPIQEGKAFCLRYFNEMSYREIARQLNVKTNVAGVLLHRAKTKLREVMKTEPATANEIVP